MGSEFGFATILNIHARMRKVEGQVEVGRNGGGSAGRMAEMLMVDVRLLVGEGLVSMSGQVSRREMREMVE